MYQDFCPNTDYQKPHQTILDHASACIVCTTCGRVLEEGARDVIDALGVVGWLVEAVRMARRRHKLAFGPLPAAPQHAALVSLLGVGRILCPAETDYHQQQLNQATPIIITSFLFFSL